jgi:DNA repair protein RadA/Sms
MKVLAKASSKKAYVCQQCGAVSVKWRGQCSDCSAWDTLIEETLTNTGSSSQESIQFETLSSHDDKDFPRMTTGINEFDRVCGGGIVAGSVSLVSGDPGIGKSTLLLQLAGCISEKTSVIYISGEESAAQIRLRAQRLGLSNAGVHLMSTNQLDDVFPLIPGVLSKGKALNGFIIVDSIQTMVTREVGTTPGTLNQIRECMQQLITLAKSTGIAIVVVGHITKEGLIAGPKVLEHMVDVVLYFEGEANRPYRLLRTIKNRFGATHEVGVFDMTSGGLKEVKNPSILFLSKRHKEIPGSCIFAGMEGSRPLLMEFQALSTPSFLASPRRSVVGWDAGRLSMILAVLEARCQIPFSKKDVFLTVLGGLRVSEPAADLCVALALLSCLKKKAIPHEAVAFGEIGLTGEIYGAAFGEQRLKEAEQLGFKHVFMPSIGYNGSITPVTMNHVRDLLAWF